VDDGDAGFVKRQKFRVNEWREHGALFTGGGVSDTVGESAGRGWRS
jgi:hypothetical protein